MSTIKYRSLVAVAVVVAAFLVTGCFCPFEVGDTCRVTESVALRQHPCCVLTECISGHLSEGQIVTISATQECGELWAVEVGDGWVPAHFLEKIE